MNKVELVAFFEQLADVMQREKENLIAMDSVVGDGDLGLTMSDGFAAAYNTVKGNQENDLGKLIYFGGDDTVSQLAGDVRSDITAIPFEEHPVVEKDGQTFLHTRYGDYPVRIPNRYFLINLNAARLACRQLGVKDADFYQALSEYSLSLSI